MLCTLGIASAIIQLVMNWAQRMVDPAQAAIIGRVAGERLPALALIGGCLIVLGVIISEWRPQFLKKKKEDIYAFLKIRYKIKKQPKLLF